uniref:Protein inhibitor of activated STAT, 1a n=1 Tax=Oryzias sinensis TaxID=183150 RepID=A0A8C7X9Q5_9TELE
MVMSLRVSELQVLLGYAGRNKHGRKHELLTKALHLLKSGCSPAVHMKIKELYRRRFPAKMVSHSELALPGPHHPASAGVVGGGGAALPACMTQFAYEGHAGHGGAPSPAALLPLSLLGPGKHELTGLAHHLPASASLHPVHPDVKLQRLPFYDMLDELIKPTSLASDNSQRFQETCFAFALTPQQVQQISSSMDISGTKCDFSVQVQLRFCLSETSCPQEDHFPPNLCVKVNGKPCTLPGYLPPTKNGVEPKRPSRPINITSLVRLSTTVPNTIVVSWTSEIGRNYSMAVYLVKQQSSTVLLQRLRAKGIRNPDHSRALIKEKLTADPDSEIATTSLRVSLLCPLGKMRLMIPCRALTCSHLQCFDATLYIQMNEKKPTWVCPVCDKKAPYEHLIIDGLFVEILNSCMDCDEIQFKEDGSWAPMRSKKEVQEVSSASCNNGLDGECGDLNACRAPGVHQKLWQDYWRGVRLRSFPMMPLFTRSPTSPSQPKANITKMAFSIGPIRPYCLEPDASWHAAASGWSGAGSSPLSASLLLTEHNSNEEIVKNTILLIISFLYMLYH